jgi:hypothetical protein
VEVWGAGLGATNCCSIESRGLNVSIRGVARWVYATNRQARLC